LRLSHSGSSRSFLCFLFLGIFVDPEHARQLAPFRIPNFIMNPVVLDALVGHGIEVKARAGWLVVKLVLDPGTLLGYLI
jgi:hypothetical protein